MSAASERPAGPSADGGPEFLIVGKIRRPHGVHGDVVVEIYTDNLENLIPNKAVFLGAKHFKVVITRRREYKDGLLLGFDKISSPEQAGHYRNQILSIAATNKSELPEGSYYFHELIDLNVVDDLGNNLGTLTDILETGANDVYVVKNPKGGELLLPAIPEVILKVDLVEKFLKVHLLPGLDEE